MGRRPFLSSSQNVDAAPLRAQNGTPPLYEPAPLRARLFEPVSPFRAQLEFNNARNYPQANALWCPLSPNGHY